MQEVSQGPDFRWAVRDLVTKKTFLEVDWGTSRPSLWSCIDGGSDQWQQQLKQYYKFRVRGSDRYDPAHRVTRCRERTIIAANGAWIKAEFGIILSFVRGPWSSEANHQLILNAASEIFKNIGHNIPLFKNFIYDRVTLSKNTGRLPPNFGTAEHLKQLWGEVQDDKLLTCIGEDFSPNHWKCFTDRMEYYLPSMDVLLFIVLYILITRGILRNIAQDFPGLVGIVRWLEAVKDGVPEPAAPVDFDIKSLKDNSKQPVEHVFVAPNKCCINR